MNKTLQISLLASLLLSAGYADEGVLLEEISISSTQGITLKKKDTTESITLITKEDLQDLRCNTLGEALSRLGGISSTQNGGVGQPSSFFLRGMDTNRVLVLIDGVRYNDPTGVGAAAQFEHIMLTNVEQIEIIKGAQSGVWGADASAGVINIITSKAKKGLSASAGVEYGSFATQKISLQGAYATEMFDLSLGGVLYDTDGFSAAEPKRADPNYAKRYDTLGYEEDGYTNNSLFAKLGYNISQHDRLELSLQTIDSDVAFDSGAGVDAPLPNTELSNRFYTLSYAHKGEMHHLKVHYSLSTFDRESELPSWSGEGSDLYNYKGSVEEFGLEDTLEYMQNSSLRVGLSHQIFTHEELTPDTDQEYSASSAFLSNHNKFSFFEIGHTILGESLRYDKYDAFENAFTGKLGLKQFVYQDLFISLNAGSGFNAPTLGELYGQWGANPDLDPQKSRTYDLTLGNDTLWLTYFDNEITDMIVYDMNTWTYIQNSGTSSLKGFELGYKDIFFDTLALSLLYNYVDPKNSADQTLARRAKEQLDIHAIYYISDTIDFGINMQYVGERYDALDKGGAQTGRYTLSNAVLNYKAGQNFSLYGKIDNITDKYYQSVDGYASPERSFFVGMHAKY